MTNPKPNGYESLHITVKNKEGAYVEVQIRLAGGTAATSRTTTPAPTCCTRPSAWSWVLTWSRKDRSWDRTTSVLTSPTSRK